MEGRGRPSLPSFALVETRVGSLEIVAEVPLAPTIPLLDIDLGLSSLTHLGQTLDAVRHRDRPRLGSLYPDSGQRARVLKSINPLLPEDGADYDVAVTVADTAVDLRSDYRPFVALASRSDEELVEESVRTLTGLLYKIEVSTGERQLGLIVDNRKIRCFYTPDYEDAVRELVPGSLVEVEGRASLSASGRLERIEEILDARSVQLIPLYWRRVVYGNRLFRLRQPIEIQVDFREGLWIHEFEPLNLLAFAHTRSESLGAFRLQFVVSWDQLAQEDDSLLTRDAQAAKGRFRDLVEAEEALA